MKISRQMNTFLARLIGFGEKILLLILSPVVFISKRLVLPGFKGVPLYDVGVFFLRGMRKSSISLRANALAFSVILSFVPAVLFLFTLIPYFPIPGLQEQVMVSLQEALPEEAFLTIRNTIEDIITNQRAELLSISFLISLYFASNGMLGVMTAFNQSAHVIETRTNFRKRLVAIFLVLVLSLLTILTAVITIFSGVVLGWLEDNGVIQDTMMVNLLHLGSWVMLFTLLLTAFSTIYYFAPAKRGSFPFFSAGSTIASIFTIGFFILFRLYVDNTNAYNRFYGSLETLFVILVWFNLMAFVLLIGFELNASIYSARRKKSRQL
jgi:membrane protein